MNICFYNCCYLFFVELVVKKDPVCENKRYFMSYKNVY